MNLPSLCVCVSGVGGRYLQFTVPDSRGNLSMQIPANIICRSGRFPEWFCIFWLARVAAPCNFSWSNTFSRDHPNNKDFFENYVAMTQCKLCIEYTSKGVIGLHLQFLEPCWAISSRMCVPRKVWSILQGGKRLSQGQREEGRS